MNTLDDLRATLDRQADGLDDTERYIRPVAVRARVRAVRRRRTAIAATAAVLVVVAAVAAAGTLRGPGEIAPAHRVVAGVDVPGSIDVLGFPYELAELTDLTDEKTQVDAADRDQVVLLAASGLGAGSATLYSQGDPVARVRGSQQVSAPVDLGDAGVDLRVRFDGAADEARAGVAVYEATGGLAPGVDNGETVFREEVAGAPLVSAAFLAPGETSFDLVVPSTGSPLRFVFYCTTPKDLWLNASVDGDGELGSSCGDAVTPDAGVGTSSTSRLPAGGDNVVRVSLSDGPDGPEVAAPADAVIGVGIYAPPADGPRVEGSRVDTHVEYDGRVWVLDEVLGEHASVDTSDGDVLLGLVGRGDEIHAVWSGLLTNGETPRMETGDDAMTSYGSILLGGDRYSVGVADGLGRLLVYRPL